MHYNYNYPRSAHDKANKMTMHPAKIQISLGICPVWSESSLCTQWVAKDPRFLHVDSEDAEQTGWMPRLIWVFAGRTATLLVLTLNGSFKIILLIYTQETDKSSIQNILLLSQFFRVGRYNPGIFFFFHFCVHFNRAQNGPLQNWFVFSYSVAYLMQMTN